VPDLPRYVAGAALSSLQAAVTKAQPAPVHRSRGCEVNERKIAFCGTIAAYGQARALRDDLD
jgi:hypothetical protein